MGLGQSRDANPDNGEASDDGMRDGLGIGIKSSGQHHQHQYRYCQTPTLGTGSLGGPPPHTRSGSASMDLPPDKAKLLKQYDNEKKWDIICDQKRKMVGESTSTQVLRDLEISLRTNHIEWVREFLDEENQGLDALIDYLSFRLLMMRHEQRAMEIRTESEEKIQTSGVIENVSLNNGCLRPPLHELKDSPSVKRRSRHYGFNMVIQHREAINCIALSLIHKSLRTKALVLELLAAICLVKGGHEIILSAFDNFKEVCLEKKRFETLMAYFTQYDNFHIEFMVACMQFVNIVVHSVEDMNFRVHLQYEFTNLGLDEYLEKLRHTESEDLQVQISAYLDNVFDVAALMEDSETKTAALEKVAELEDELGHVKLETELGAIKVEYVDALEARRLVEEELTALKRQKQDSARRQSVLESKIIELETLTGTLTKGSTVASLSNGTAGLSAATSPTSENVVSSTVSMSPTEDVVRPAPVAAPPPPPPPPCPPPPPPPPMVPMAPGDNKISCSSFIPPPPAGMMQAPDERFKIGMSGHVTNGTNEIDGLQSFPSKRFKKPENVSLLEHTRLRNIAISRRKMEMPIEKIKAYREYIIEKKNVNLLTEEDKFLMQLGKVERISTKLSIMNYIGNFFDNLHLITPQVHAVISASSSVKCSKKLRAVLEIILAFGNYLNSSKRGPAYGFKLQSLDTLLDTKSTDKRMCLLHYIVATIRLKFPELINFESELMYIDKAATVSLENITTDVHELEKGMDQVRKEFELRGKEKHNTVLRDFLNNSEEKLRRLKSDARIAGDAFRECVEFFGESPRQADANTFFSLLVRFARAFKAADQENEQRRRLEAAAAEALSTSEEVTKRNKLNQKKQQDAVINELKNKTRLVHEKKLLQQDEVYNGALEDILLGLRSEPYRRADAVRRSQRRRIDNHRLSRTAEELEF
ncbi:hypothetical protein G9C98_004633 [Cotesia typhae]|uniref:Formin-like protein n=1 Tax=Cotesia typhae TaxID=2053667 RepID=A0A8J5RB39_9HYME|nr:hypothetical protein G9C98_004633 [Cotesia typhae]